ncbi:FAD-dependent oxidoreductase [soil metagenome]
MAELGSIENPLRVAIVGSGPAGFYAAEQLLKPDEPVVEVDVFDKLPTPYGLVRAGVAPEHPKIKSVTRVYEKTAARPGFRFFGNVEVGKHISAAELAERYNAVIYAYGTSTDRKLGIPGEGLPGSHPATTFVAWYNAHPDFRDGDFDLNCKRVVVIGNGNVAADVARMLALDRGELEETDTAGHAIDALAESGVEEIVVIGRRGPAQAAFTTPEVRELGEMNDADIIIEQTDVELDEHSRAQIESGEAAPTNVRNVEVLTQFAGREATGKRRRIVLRFLSSPIEILGSEKVEGIVIGRNRLEPGENGTVRAVDTGERETLECGLILRSIGYKGIGVDGVPFDSSQGTIPNDHGRALDLESGHQVPGIYAVGWIKRGPSGVIGTNKKDAADTVQALLTDLEQGRVPERGSGEVTPIDDLLAERQPDFVSFSGWSAIDHHERAAGEPLGRPRVKFTSLDDLLDAARREPVA